MFPALRAVPLQDALGLLDEIPRGVGKILFRVIGHHDGLGKVAVQGEGVHRIPGGLGRWQQGLAGQKQLRIDGEAHALHGQGEGGLDVPCFQQDPGRDVVSGKEPVRHAPDPILPIEEDKGQIPEGGDVHPVGEGAAHLVGPRPKQLPHEGLRHHQEQPLPADFGGLKGVQIPGHIADEQIDPALGQVFLELRGGSLQNGHGDARMPLVKGGQQPGEQGLAPGVADADPELAGVVVVQIIQLQMELPFDGADLLGGGLQPLPGGGEGEPGVPLKELGSQLLLQLADLPGQGLFGDVEALGGLRHVHLLGHDQKVLQILKVHPFPPRLRFKYIGQARDRRSRSQA